MIENINIPRGVFCPVITPFDEQLRPDKQRFVQQCHKVLQDGCHGVAVFGTTGEASSLSVDEREILLEALLESGIKSSLVIPGTGCSALTDSIRLTRHAVELGCARVLMLPPFYYKGISTEGLFRSFAEIIERVADTSLKIYLYHIPPVSGIALDLSLIQQLVNAYPDCVVGLKDSSGDWTYTETLLKTLPGFGAFSGSEVFLRDNLTAGGVGTITALANINSAEIRTAYDGFQDEDGESLQSAITRRRKIVQDYPMIPALKAIIAAITGDPNWARVRPPLLPLGTDQTNRLIASLIQDNFLPLSGVTSPKTL